MDKIKEILKKFENKEISIEDAEKLLKANLIKNVEDFAQLDIFRELRTGVPEVILGINKSAEMLLKICLSFLEEHEFVIITRFTESQKGILLENINQKEDYDVEIKDLAKIMVIKKKEYDFPQKEGKVGIITAGSSDIAVAEEAKIMAKVMGCETFTSYDAGIAGIHRIFKPLSKMIKAGVQVIIVCAGMEGTLPGVVAALVDIPVIGVPISSGYGLGEGGKGALTTMLQSCSPGLVVVNIDNGFGAGVSAALIANR